MQTIRTEPLTFQIAPEDQGQMIEVAYATYEDGLVQRVTDRSADLEDPARVTYYVCDWDDVDGEFAPQNGAPAVDATAWTQARIVFEG